MPSFVLLYCEIFRGWFITLCKQKIQINEIQKCILKIFFIFSMYTYFFLHFDLGVNLLEHEIIEIPTKEK